MKYFYFFLVNPHSILLEWEGGGEKQQCEEDRSIGCLLHEPLTKLNPQALSGQAAALTIERTGQGKLFCSQNFFAPTVFFLTHGALQK